MPEIGQAAVTYASSVVGETAYGQSSAAGSAATASRGDHTHGSPAVNRSISANDANPGLAVDQDSTGIGLRVDAEVASLVCRRGSTAATEFQVLVNDSTRVYKILDCFDHLVMATNDKHIKLGDTIGKNITLMDIYRAAGSFNQYDVVIIDTGNDRGCATIAAANSPLVLGVSIGGGTIGQNSMVARRGQYPVTVLTATAVARGDILTTSGTAGYAGVNNGATRDLWLGRALTAKAGGTAGTVICELMAG